jgi:5-formyltetrahydrofolate cyclo-ligase
VTAPTTLAPRCRSPLRPIAKIGSSGGRQLSEANDVSTWRSRQRERLIAARLDLAPTVRAAAENAIVRTLITHLGVTNPGVVGCYWPHQGEPNLYGAMLRIIDLGGRVALPAPVRPHRPMEFRGWGPQSKMIPGVGGILQPASGEPLSPDMLIIPIVGFDARGYRLGYGGGYYDRTLAALSPRPPTLGVGFELGRLKTLHRQPHDVPLDAIVTEAGLHKLAR